MNGIDPEPERLRISAQQRQLAEALGQVAARLQQAYIGALFVLGDVHNPDRLALAAHGIREMMEKLPRDVASSEIEYPVKLDHTSDTVKLQKAWKEVRRTSNCFNNEGWNGTIDPPLRQFLNDAGYYFDRREENIADRRTGARKLLVQLDPTGRPLPPHIEDVEVKAWDGAQRFFIKISHHGTEDASEEEFRYNLQTVEDLLLARLRPRSAENQAMIEDIIREAEARTTHD